MLKLGTSDLNADFDLRQDYYGTGDEKAFETKYAALSTPFGNHFVNSVTYNEQHPIGPSDVPFEFLDQLSSGSKSLQDVLRIYNRDIYTLSLSTGTNFDEMAQPITYQLNTRLSPRSLLVIGGFWGPGPGNGFGITNVQAITPFGRDTSLQISTNVDWKNKGRLENKTAYLTKVVGDCYRLDSEQSRLQAAELQRHDPGLPGTGSAVRSQRSVADPAPELRRILISPAPRCGSEVTVDLSVADLRVGIGRRILIGGPVDRVLHVLRDVDGKREGRIGRAAPCPASRARCHWCRP